jgi:hypothetical protein
VPYRKRSWLSAHIFLFFKSHIVTIIRAPSLGTFDVAKKLPEAEHILERSLWLALSTIEGMTTIVEKTSDGTIYRAAKTYPIPDVDVLTLLFGTCHLVT